MRLLDNREYEDYISTHGKIDGAVQMALHLTTHAHFYSDCYKSHENSPSMALSIVSDAAAEAGDRSSDQDRQDWETVRDEFYAAL
jgi:hypothetical protein